MSSRRRKGPREKDLTSRFLSGGLDPDRVDTHQRFSRRNADAQINKTTKTAARRQVTADAAEADGTSTLLSGEVVQVFSLYCEVEHADRRVLCVVRKTLNKVHATSVVVGDKVMFRDGLQRNDLADQHGVVESIGPRRSLLLRADSFKSLTGHPIVANADQMLIVVSLLQPRVKWGLVDRMVAAAHTGGLAPIICLNKLDLATGERGEAALIEAQAALAHYESIGVRSVQTCAVTGGVGPLREWLAGKATVLAGHSGVGKSSLVRVIDPSLDIRVAEVSKVNEKGRHTTTSARRYTMEIAGRPSSLIDTPGVRHFGLWNVSADVMDELYPDVVAGTAPDWRIESRDSILASIDNPGG